MTFCTSLAQICGASRAVHGLMELAYKICRTVLGVLAEKFNVDTAATSTGEKSTLHVHDHSAPALPWLHVRWPSSSTSAKVCWRRVRRSAPTLGRLTRTCELLTAFHKSERREPYGEKRGSKSIKETCAPKGNKETCANPLSNPIINSLFTKREPLLVNMFLHLFGGNGL